jgi:hypothetical protein
VGGRTQREAVRNFADSMQKSASCVTKSVLRLPKNPYDESREMHTLTFPDDPITLRGDEDKFALSVRHQYRIVRGEGLYGRWKVRTVGYYYELQDEGNTEILSYHWHPESRSPLIFPHMHIGWGSGAKVEGLFKPHYPTPRTPLEDFLWMLIEDFGVRHEHADWKKILKRGRATYEQDRTWINLPTEREA